MRRSISVKSASQVCGNAGKTAVVGLHQLGSTGYLGHTSVQQISQCCSCSHQTGGLARKRFLRTTLLPRGRRSKCPIQARRQGGGCVGCDRTPPPIPPQAENVRLERTCLAEKRRLVSEKNAKDEPFSSDLSLYPMLFSAVDHLELCSCY